MEWKTVMYAHLSVLQLSCSTLSVRTTLFCDPFSTSMTKLWIIVQKIVPASSLGYVGYS